MQNFDFGQTSLHVLSRGPEWRDLQLSSISGGMDRLGELTSCLLDRKNPLVLFPPLVFPPTLFHCVFALAYFFYCILSHNLLKR